MLAAACSGFFRDLAPPPFFGGNIFQLSWWAGERALQQLAKPLLCTAFV